MFKCCPPIREESNRDLLWEALLDGTIDIVVSDHSPSSPHLKHLDTGDFGTAWGGVSSLQLGLSVVWTEARRRGIPLERVVEWMSSGPAAIAGLRRKGAIEVGRDADLVVFAPEDAFTVEPRQLHHKHAITPYAGRTLAGVVRRTLLRGADVTDEPRGALLTRGDA
jgi:allantoinase